MSTPRKNQKELESALNDTKNKLFVERKITAKIPELNFKIRRLEDEQIRTKELLDETTSYYKTLHEEYQKKEQEVTELHDIERKFNQQKSELSKIMGSYAKMEKDFAKANDKANSTLSLQYSLTAAEYTKTNLNSKITELNKIIIETKKKADMVDIFEKTLEKAKSQIMGLSNLAEQKSASEAQLLNQYKQVKNELSKIPQLTEKIKKLEDKLKTNNSKIEGLNKNQFASEVAISQIHPLTNQLRFKTEEVSNLKNLVHDSDKKKTEIEVLYKVFEKKCLVIPELNQQIGAIRQELHERDFTIGQKNSELQSLEINYNNELLNIGILNETICQLNLESEEKTKTIQNKQQEFTNLEFEKNQLQKENSEIPAMESALKYTKHQIMVLDQKILELNQIHLSKEKDVQSMHRNIGELKFTIQDRENTIININDEQNKLLKNIKNLKQEVEHYRTKYLESEKSSKIIPDQENQLSNLKTKNNTLENILDTKSNEAAEDLAQIKKQEIEQSQTKFEISKNSSENKQHLKIINDLNQQLSEKNTKIGEQSETQTENQKQKESLDFSKKSLAYQLDYTIQLELGKKELEAKILNCNDTRIQAEMNNALKLAEKEKLLIEKDNWVCDLQEKSTQLSDAFYKSEEAKESLAIELKCLKQEATELEKENVRLSCQEILREKAYEDRNGLEEKIEDMEKDLDGWMQRYSKTKDELYNFMPRYQNLQEENECMKVACEDHVHEMEKKAVLINKLQTRLVGVLSELDRIKKTDAPVGVLGTSLSTFQY